MDNIKKRGRPPKTAYKEPKRQGNWLPSKRVYICVPLKGNIEKNIAQARIYCRFAYEKRYVPICPAIYYTQFLDDTDKDERAAGLHYALQSMWQANQLWVCGERVTKGMEEEISLAKKLKIKIRYFDVDMNEIIDAEGDLLTNG